MNVAVLADATAAAAESRGPASPPESPVSPLTPELADLLETAGLSNPLEKASRLHNNTASSVCMMFTPLTVSYQLFEPDLVPTK